MGIISWVVFGLIAGILAKWIMPGKDGLVHISQIAHERVKNVGDYLQVGQTVNVKALEVDDRGRVRLSIKALIEAPAREPKPEAAE